jgi:diaminohydroxyphosphoribosylaminopyrimidine deaminase/5-amino-6-(5-phosphoribosylamino)uracil reductase
MALAIEAAARGRTSPNPRVGAVIASNDDVIAVGFHEGPGQAHAEVAALRAAGERARGATLYCTLEPCNHHGRTPPCTEAILAAGVARVVIGARDPKRYPTGPGLDRLREAGIAVDVGVSGEACTDLIEDFTCLVRRGRPLVIGKAAVTLDGRIATAGGDSKWITGELARTEAHRMRDRADAVMVGIETVLADDPALDVRMIEGRDPLRIVLDTHLRTPANAKVIVGKRAQVLLAHGPEASVDRRATLRAAGAELIELPLEHGRVSLPELLTALGAREVMQVLVEGGGRVLGALLDADLLDRLATFVAPVVLGDPLGRPLAHRSFAVQNLAQATRLTDVRIRTFGDDVLIEGRVPHRD